MPTCSWQTNQEVLLLRGFCSEPITALLLCYITTSYSPRFARPLNKGGTKTVWLWVCSMIMLTSTNTTFPRRASANMPIESYIAREYWRTFFHILLPVNVTCRVTIPISALSYILEISFFVENCNGNADYVYSSNVRHQTLSFTIQAEKKRKVSSTHIYLGATCPDLAAEPTLSTILATDPYRWRQWA